MTASGDRPAAPGPPPVQILDAGCGRQPQDLLDLPEAAHAHVVGIDISQAALDANDSLDEKLLGDLETYPLPPDTFDVAVCWDVLEHLRRPELALENLTRSLRPGGRLILGIPNVLTPKALATKFTPHRFHVFIYRRVFDFPNAGLHGHGPFPTYLRWSLRPAAIETFARTRSLRVEELTRLPSASMAPLYERFPRTTGWLARIWRLLFNTDPRESELKIVLRKGVRRIEADER